MKGKISDLHLETTTLVRQRQLFLCTVEHLSNLTYTFIIRPGRFSIEDSSLGPKITKFIQLLSLFDARILRRCDCKSFQSLLTANG